MRIEKLTESHFNSLLAQDITGRLHKWADEGYFEQAVLSLEAFSAINRFGHVVAIGGIMEYWPGRAEVWGMIATGTPGEFLAVHKAAHRMCSRYWGRLECVVNFDFTEGHRWAKKLGFRTETAVMKGYFQDGSDATMYVRHGYERGN